MSALASQLQNIASIDASRLTSKTGAPSSKSYLFPPKTAASHDLDAIFSLAQSGYAELVELDPGFEEFGDSLFSEHARRTDRTQLNQEENDQLDKVLGRCLRRLGRWVGVMAGGKCIEWLVRRFRVHEMNAETVLQVFLPYHQSPNFPRMLSILTIPQKSRYYAPFSPLIKDAQPLQRSYITQSISPSRDKSLRLLIDVAGMVQSALAEGVVHRGLLAFWSATMVELIETERAGKGVGEALVKVLVEAFVGILETQNGGQDVNAAVYPPLILIARSIRLADGPFAALLSALIAPKTGADPSQRILTLLFLLNERRDWSGGMGENACAHLCKIKGLSNLLIGSMEKYHFDDAVRIVSTVLLQDITKSGLTLKHLIEYRDLPTDIVGLLAEELLRIGSEEDISDTDSQSAKSLLQALVERHPTHVEAARLARTTAGHSTAENLIQQDNSAMAFVNAYSADSEARIQSIVPLLSAMGVNVAGSEGDVAMEAVESTDKEAAIEKIQLLLADTEDAVVSALYQAVDNDATTFVETLTSARYINTVQSAFVADKPNSAIRLHHLQFIAKHLPAGNPVVSQQVFDKLLFPNLLSTKTKASLSEAELKVILGKGSFREHELLASDAMVSALKDAQAGTATAKNLVMADAIAQAVAHSTHSGSYQKLLLAQLSSSTATSRLLAHLVLASLLQTLNAEASISLGVSVLASLDKSLQTSTLRAIENSEDPMSPAYLQAISAKTDEAQTSRMATISLVSSFCTFRRPSDARVDWFGTSDFKTLSTILYRHANSDALPPTLARKLLQHLFAVLREDTLTFLACVWTDINTAEPLRVAALRHACAFAKSYALGTDFQMVVPSVLVAFTAKNQAIREAAVALLKVVNRSASNETKNYYALDTFYGDQTDKVQLLKHGDLIRYLQALIPALDDITVDASRLIVVHTATLSMNHGRGRKETGHRRSVIGSLLSHVRAIQAPSTRLALLRTIGGVHDTAVLRGVLPLISTLLDEQSQERQWLDSLSAIELDEYVQLLTGAFTAQSAALLVDKESDAGQTARSLLGPGQTPLEARLRELVLQRMISGVFDALPSDHKVSCFGHIVKMLHSLDEPSQSTVVKSSLKRFNLDVTSLILIIDDLSKPLSDTSAQPKKQKQDTSAGKMDQAVADLTVLLESRDWKTVPGDAQLVATLMVALSTLLAKRQSIKEGVDYLEQEILAAILSLVERIQNPEEIQRAHVGVEVIIKVIRASTNPRTSQRALLVASELARLIPDAVLHNIMPIFTFMSASDLQRDDAYSFGVVEKTVSRIVPVMTRSLKDKVTSKLELYNESLTFISIFTDMAGRLPRHRTMPFFRHLTQSLGPSDYLAPVTMLLADRTITKSGRSAGLTLDLPLGIVGTFDVPIRLGVISEIVQELGRLVPDLANPDKTAFLSRLLTDQGDSDRTLRQISVLLRFGASIIAQLVGRPCDQSAVEEIVRNLILLSSAARTASLHETEVGQLLYSAIGAAMQLLSAENFLSIISKLLESDTTTDIKVALEIFVDRLPLIKSPVRTKCAPTMGSIVDRTAALLVTHPELTDNALAGLRAIASTALASEDPALSKSIPKVVEVVKTASETSIIISAMSLLELTSRHLASRIIPHAQSLIAILLSAAQKTSAVSLHAFTALAAVIEAIPTFISSKQLIAVLRASIEQLEGVDGSSKLLSVVAKKVPTKTLFPVIMDLWKEVQDLNASAMEGFFHLLRLTLRNADRQNLPSMIKSIFAFFLDVFDLRHRLQKRGVDQDVINSIEESAIGSFLELVVKLNEVTFKPLFIRLYDWAVIDLSEGAAPDSARLIERKIVLLHVMMGLLQKFKHLLSPYIGTLLPHIEELLPAYASGEIKDEALWTLLLEVLAKSYEVDDGAFWTDQHHLKLIPMLTAQLPLFPSKSSSPLATALSQLAGSTTSTPVLKSLNTALCLATRSDSVGVRLSALGCLDAIWEKQSDEMIQFVPETVSEFLSELLEDENSDVERNARKLLARIEGLTGSLKEYLE